MTSILQVLDVVVNKPLKDNLCESYSHWVINNVSHEFIKSCRIKELLIWHICNWILESIALDGSEDGMMNPK